MALPDTAPRFVGFILSCGEGHEFSKDKQIHVCANEVKSCLEPAEQAGQWRTEAARLVQNMISTFNDKIWNLLMYSLTAAKLKLASPCVRDVDIIFRRNTVMAFLV